MAKYKETCDLYDDEGKLLKSNVALDKVSPLVNPAIKKLINTTQPLSDDEVARRLKEKGIVIARRTVAKYRGELNILPSNLRKVY
jgi:DNA-directed RNA polymerase specialized sigma54-like protein